MTADLALGIDVGTSGVRASAITATGQEIAAGAATMGSARRDPETWRRALAEALHALLSQIEPDRIGAVAVDGTSGTVLALDADNAPVGEALMYNDAVEDPEIPAAIARVAPRQSAAHGAASGLARAIVLQGRPGAQRILHQADWIAHLLGDGPGISDESNALKTGYDPVTRCWPDWLHDTPLRGGLLPDVVPCGSATGSTSGTFGLPAGATLVAGVSDGCASFLATGAATPGDAVTALGTTLTIKLLSDRPIFAPEFGIYSHRIGEMWLAGGASNTGGGVLVAHFSPEQIAELSAGLSTDQPTGLDYYPLTRPGERFPIMDPDLPPRLTPRPESDAVFLQGMLEGMARIEAEGYARLGELGAPAVTSLRTVGGGAGNAAWSALRQRALEVAHLPAQSEAAASGVAQLALAHLPGAR